MTLEPEHLPGVQHYDRINEEDIASLTDEEFDRRDQLCEDVYRKLLLARGDVLNMAVELEQIMIRCISDFFFPDGGTKCKFFRTSVLQKQFCSFDAKTEVLKDICELTGKLEPHPSWTAIRKTAELRNIFAHGRIVIDWVTCKTFIDHAKGRDEALPLIEKFRKKYAQARGEVCDFEDLISKSQSAGEAPE